MKVSDKRVQTAAGALFVIAGGLWPLYSFPTMQFRYLLGIQIASVLIAILIANAVIRKRNTAGRTVRHSFTIEKLISASQSDHDDELTEALLDIRRRGIRQIAVESTEEEVLRMFRDRDSRTSVLWRAVNEAKMSQRS